jgi:hypothetical protein
MASFNYSPQQAEQFLFAEGWDKYHDRYFTRCYVQEGENALRGGKSAEWEFAMMKNVIAGF